MIKQQTTEYRSKVFSSLGLGTVLTGGKVGGVGLGNALKKINVVMVLTIRMAGPG